MENLKSMMMLRKFTLHIKNIGNKKVIVVVI